MMSFVVYEVDLVKGEGKDPHTFQTRDEARAHAVKVVKGWCEGDDRIIFEGNMVLVNTRSGLLDFGALITEVA